ncbi:MAG TPA: transcription antitermination factor NusB [Steroidobacteraceae bacterium]|nr:transcription antitermination factor NusB [Steroidobacteraceae bacterium]
MAPAGPRRRERTESHARAAARRVALQALYRWQLNRCEWQELVQEFADEAQSLRADAPYLQVLVRGVVEQHAELDAALAPLLDRKPADLDPIEHAALLIGSFELQQRPEVPFRVAVSEAVALARRFGASEGHTLVNAVLDRAGRLWRAAEVR